MRDLLSILVGIASLTIAMQASPQEIVTQPGTHQLMLPESQWRYTLIIPADYARQETVPLVVSLHFGGRVTPWVGRSLLEQLIEPALRELGAIIIAPDSAAGSWTNSTAEQHVLELIEFIESNYNIDSNRTLLTGYSMGAMGTWYLAPRHPELFEAAIPIAGRPQSDSTELNWQTPTYVLNSFADEVIPISPARAAVEVLQSRGAPIEFTFVDEITHYQIPRYRSHLANIIPWIRSVWDNPPATR